MLLGRYMPDFDQRESHSIAIAAPPEVALAETRRLTAREVPLFTVLMALRSPAAVLGGRLSLDRPILEEFQRAGFALLAERPDEIVLGGVGRFWTPSGGLRRVPAEKFADFAEPGWAKAAVNFHAAPADGRTLLSTETRVLATDERARLSFGRYWRLVHPGSAAIRRTWLRAVRRGAEHRQT
jgi:hypothetical protein